MVVEVCSFRPGTRLGRAVRHRRFEFSSVRENESGNPLQFEYLNRRIKRQLQQHQPVISVDTKKKELVGDFKNNGRELRPRGAHEWPPGPLNVTR